jgi:hypothetical protein
MKSDMEIAYVAPSNWSLGDRMNMQILKTNPLQQRLRTRVSTGRPICPVEPYGVSRLHAERDAYKGSPDTPRMATQ